MMPVVATERLLCGVQVIFAIVLALVAALNISLFPQHHHDYWSHILVTCVALIIPFPVRHGRRLEHLPGPALQQPRREQVE